MKYQFLFMELELAIVSKTLYMQGKHTTSELNPRPPLYHLEEGSLKLPGWLLFDLSALKVWPTAVSFSILEVCSPLICAKPYSSFMLCPLPSLTLLFDDAQTVFKSFLKAV